MFTLLGGGLGGGRGRKSKGKEQEEVSVANVDVTLSHTAIMSDPPWLHKMMQRQDADGSEYCCDDCVATTPVLMAHATNELSTSPPSSPMTRPSLCRVDWK